MIQSHPLHWPVGHKRTLNRSNSKFKPTPEATQKYIRNEIKLLGASNLIVSTNVPERADGFIYGDMSQTNIKDPGIAVYFKWKKQDVCICCDRYLKPIDNLHAIGKTIEALRGIERWGASDFLDQVFTGFKALPMEATPIIVETWYSILKIDGHASNDEIKSAWKKRCIETHPDKTSGDSSEFNKVQNAWEEAKKIRGIK